LTIRPARRTIATNRAVVVSAGTTELYGGVVSAGWAPTEEERFGLGSANRSDKLLGFKAKGSFEVEPQENGGSTVFNTAMGLPAQLGPVTGEGRFDYDANGITTGAGITVGGATLAGLVTLPSIALQWTQGATWSAAFDLRIPLLEVGVGTEMTITSGRLDSLAIYFAPPKGVPLGSTGAELDFLAGEGDGKPPGFSFGGSIGASAGPKVGKFSVLRLDTTFSAAVGRSAEVPEGLESIGLIAGTDLGKLPFQLYVAADVKMLNVIPVAHAHLNIWATPKPIVALDGRIGLDVKDGTCGGNPNKPFIQVQHKAEAGLAITKGDFNLSASGVASLTAFCVKLLSAGATFNASTKGMGVCGFVQTVFGKIGVGVGARWPRGNVTVGALLRNIKMFTGCDLTPYRSRLTVAPAAVAASSAGPTAA
ncbi:MAG: hypothetical protein ACRDMZ_17835, partial [Solirubrobacteraceae bacterium]